MKKHLNNLLKKVLHHSNRKKRFNQTFTCKLPGKKNIELTEV